MVSLVKAGEVVQMRDQEGRARQGGIFQQEGQNQGQVLTFTLRQRPCHTLVCGQAIVACHCACQIEIRAGESQQSHVCPCAGAGP